MAAFGAPHGMGAVVFPPQPDRGDPLIDEASILPRAHRLARKDPAWEHEIIDGAAPPQKPCCQTRAGVRGDFKFARVARFFRWMIIARSRTSDPATRFADL